MLLKHLVEKIQSLESLSAREKSTYTNLLARLNKTQLQEMASLVLQFEEQEKNLHLEEQGILKKIKALFTKMNLYAVKTAKRVYFKRVEEEEIKESLKTLDQLLNQL